MGEVFKVHVEGLAELETKLRELPDATAKNVLRRVARKRLEPVAQRARELAPVHMQEFGTVHNGPHPFLRPAWDAEKDKVLAGLKDDLWAEIEKAAKRIARKAAKAAAEAGD